MCVYVCMYIVYVHFVCVCKHVRMWVCMCMRVRMCVCVCAYVCVGSCLAVNRQFTGYGKGVGHHNIIL